MRIAISATQPHGHSRLGWAEQKVSQNSISPKKKSNQALEQG